MVDKWKSKLTGSENLLPTDTKVLEDIAKQLYQRVKDEWEGRYMKEYIIQYKKYVPSTNIEKSWLMMRTHRVAAE